MCVSYCFFFLLSVSPFVFRKWNGMFGAQQTAKPINTTNTVPNRLSKTRWKYTATYKVYTIQWLRKGNHKQYTCHIMACMHFLAVMFEVFWRRRWYLSRVHFFSTAFCLDLETHTEQWAKQVKQTTKYVTHIKFLACKGIYRSSAYWAHGKNKRPPSNKNMAKIEEETTTTKNTIP